MTFLLDNLTAVVVGSILIGALFVLQQRGQQDAIEAAQRHQAQTHASTLATSIERELENARSRPDTESAFEIAPGGMRFGEDTYRLRLQRATAADGTEYTSQFSFPTLSEPGSYAASPIYVVTYHIEETGETVRVDGRDRPLLTATRYEFPRGGPLVETMTFTNLVDFDVTAITDDGSTINDADILPRTPIRAHVELRYAPTITANRASDQSQGEIVSTRHARTARVVAAMAATELALADLTVPGGIPRLPGDDGFTPGSSPSAYAPPPPSDGGSSGGSSGGTDPGGSGGGTDSGGSSGGTDSGGSGGGTDSGGGSAPETSYTLCHDEDDTLTLTASQMLPHLEHGDSLGACSGG